MIEKSGYILAGFETLATIINNFILNTKGQYSNNFTRHDYSKFLGQTCSGFLHSFGQNLAKKKKTTNHIKQEVEVFQKCRNMKLFDHSDFICDSGGFQISIGKFDTKQAHRLIDLYYDFLENHHSVIDKAFILDVPPGPGCKVFNSYQIFMILIMIPI